MTALLGTLQWATLALAGLGLGLAALSAALYPALRRHLRFVTPAFRAFLLGAWAAAPLVGGGLLTALCFLPGEVGLAGFDDHCLEHPGHGHLCLVHRVFPSGGLSWAGLVALGALGLGALALHLPDIAKARRARVALRALAGGGSEGDVVVVPSLRPFAATLGAARPTVYLSSALVDAVEPTVLEVIRAHEAAHVQRRDPLRLAAARVLSIAHVPRVRDLLMADLVLACEQAADEVAAREVGDPLRVAGALLSVERLLGEGVPLPGGAAFAHGHLAARVEALADRPRRPLGRASRLAMAAFLAGGLALLSSPLHHVTETLLALLTR